MFSAGDNDAPSKEKKQE